MNRPSDPAVGVLRHALATLAYRVARPLREAPPGFADHQTDPASRTPLEIVAHLGDLMEWATSMVKGQPGWHDARPGSWEEETARLRRTMAKLDEALVAGPIQCSLARLFQGPIADALTHTGQLSLLRRLAGAPVRGENYFVAEITAGRVGADQASPKRELEDG